VSYSHYSHIQSYKCIRVLCSSGSLCSSSHVRPTADTLIKYKARKLVGKWSAPTNEQGQILALSTAQLELLNKADKQPNKGPNDSSRKPQTSGRDNKWAWKDVLSKEGEPKTKEFEGKQYHVNCPYHLIQWIWHSAQDCSKKPDGVTDAATPPDAAASSAPSARGLKAAKLAAVVLTAEGGSGDESQEGDSTAFSV
jgi:hypothetical protein